MKINRILIAKCIVTFSLFLFIGLPFIWLRKVVWPSQITIAIWFLVSFSYILLWRDFPRFKRNWVWWIFALAVIILALIRKSFLPPCRLAIYDVFFISLALSCIFHPSGIKDLLIFSSCLIAPLSIAELYGFVPSFYENLLLIGLGLMAGIYFSHWSKGNRKGRGGELSQAKELAPADFALYFFLAVLGGALTFFMVSFPKGSPKNGRIVFDIGHGTTESPQIDYNKHMDTSAIFGHAKLVKLLKRHNFQVDFIHQITHASLSESSILALIMPSLPYTRDEIEVIKEFVSHGGGLLVIGDHSDLSNVLSSLNPVIEQFGIGLRFDTIWLQTNDRTDLCYRPHPAIFDLEKVNFSVGASLDIKPPARPVILSRHAAFSDFGDPDNEDHGYLGNSRLDRGERIRDLCLVADCLYGQGRVFVMGDSAYFQNASLYQNRIFAYRLFDWLNHRQDDCSRRKAALIALAIFILLLLGVIIYRRSLSSILLALLIISTIFSLWLGGFLNLKCYPRPQEVPNKILIDMAHQNEYSLYWINRENSDTGLEGLVSQIIRSDLYPVIKSRGQINEDEISAHKAYFVICPNKPFSDQEIEDIAQFVETGGGLLLVEVARKWACSQALWERFGLFKDRYPLSVHQPILSPFGLPIRLPYGNFRAQSIPHPVTKWVPHVKMVNPCMVRGGQPIALINDKPVITFKEFGQGRIIAIGDDRFFANYITEFEGKVIDFDKIRIIRNIIDYLTYAL